MKIPVLTFFSILIMTATSALADTYKAGMTGIECTGCKKKIMAAMGALPGVESVRVAPLKKKGQHILKVKTDGTVEITMEQVKEAVSMAEHYQLTTWEKVDS